MSGPRRREHRASLRQFAPAWAPAFPAPAQPRDGREHDFQRVTRRESARRPGAHDERVDLQLQVIGPLAEGFACTCLGAGGRLAQFIHADEQFLDQAPVRDSRCFWPPHWNPRLPHCRRDNAEQGIWFRSTGGNAAGVLPPYGAGSRVCAERPGHPAKDLLRMTTILLTSVVRSISMVRRSGTPMERLR